MNVETILGFLLEIAGGALDRSVSGGGFAEVGAGSCDPVFLGVANRPDIHGSAGGPCAFQSRFGIDQIELIREPFPSKDHTVSFDLNPFYRGDLFQVLNAFL